MRLVTFRLPESRETFAASGPRERVGLQVGPLGAGEIVDVAAVPSGRDLPGDLLGIIRGADAALPVLRDIERAASAGALPAGAVYAEADVLLLSPLPRPVSMRDGYAFRQHVESARRNRGLPMIPEFDRFPIFYFTNHLAVTGPGPVHVQKLAEEKLDFELEAAVVIGKGGRNIPAERADAHIFGYMVMNDWSARHLQMEEMKLNLGPAKGKDFATSLGPYLVTRDELADAALPGPRGERHGLRMTCTVNERRVSEGSLRDMTWTFAELVERASYGVELHPGEVIGSGTVGTGCFLELNGSGITNQWLKPGDRVVLEIERLGRLENTVVAAEPTPLDLALPR